MAAQARRVTGAFISYAESRVKNFKEAFFPAQHWPLQKRKKKLRLVFLNARNNCIRWRPYRVECTGSLLTSEVKRRRARLVLGWGTAWEDLRVLPAFAQHAFDQSVCVFFYFFLTFSVFFWLF